MRESLRVLRQRPGFSAAVVLVLALCMGFNSALFTVLDALWLRPLPFPQSDRLVEIAAGRRTDLRNELQRARSVESAGAFLGWGFPVADAGGAHMAFGFRVTADLIPLLKVQAALGRALTRADFGAHTAMIGHDYWRSLGTPPDIAGRSLTIDGEPYFIAGVLPADFYLGVRDVNVIVPNLGAEGRTLARLHPGVTPAQAQAEIAGLVGGGPVEVVPADRAWRSNDGRPLALLLATAGLVLLIVCANLANLQLVRGLARRREFAIRTAMGATRGHLIGQLALESAMLGAAGAALGLLFTRALHDAILAALPLNIGRRLAGTDALSLDGRVAGFTGGIAVATILLFGVLPALSSLRFDLTAALRDTARGASGERQRFGRALVALETALALMLLAGASLALKSLTQLQSQYLGFHPAGVLRAMTDFSPTRYARPERQAALFSELERRIGGLRGVSSVGIVAPQAFPFGGPAVGGSRFEISGRPEVEGRAEVYTANPGYLAAIGLPLIRGRWFNDADTLTGQPVAVLSETVVRRYWGETECLGRAIRLDADRADSVWTAIVGVVGDVKNPVAGHWQPTAYRPFAQSPSGGATLMVRSAGGVRPLAAAVGRELHAIDPAAPGFRVVAPLEDAVRDYVSPQRFTTELLVLFAAAGLLLASAGVYAVMRYWVASRTSEIGIRLALGAERSGVMRLVLGRACSAAALGVAGGIAGAIAIRKVMAAYLIGVSPTDPWVLGITSAAIFAVAVAAAWLPARRASRVDPAEALRAE
jgi:putative ABC transport system permease protein